MYFKNKTFLTLTMFFPVSTTLASFLTAFSCLKLLRAFITHGYDLCQSALFYTTYCCRIAGDGRGLCNHLIRNSILDLFPPTTSTVECCVAEVTFLFRLSAYQVLKCVIFWLLQSFIPFLEPYFCSLSCQLWPIVWSVTSQSLSCLSTCCPLRLFLTPCSLQ